MKIERYDTIQIELTGRNEGVCLRGFFLSKKESDWNSLVTLYRIRIYIGQKTKRHIIVYAKRNIKPCRMVLFEKDLYNWERTEEMRKWKEYITQIRAYTDTINDEI